MIVFEGTYVAVIKVREKDGNSEIFFNSYFSETGKVIDFKVKHLKKLIAKPGHLRQVCICDGPIFEPAFESKVRVYFVGDVLALNIEIIDLSSFKLVSKVVIVGNVLREAEPIPFDSFFIYLITSSIWIANRYLKRYLPGCSLKVDVFNTDVFAKARFSSRYLV